MSPWALLRDAARRSYALRGVTLRVLVLGVALTAVTVPVVSWLARASAAAAGVQALTHQNVVHVLTTPGSVVLLVVLAVVVGVVVLAQHGAFVAVAWRADQGGPVTLRGVLHDLARAARGLCSPQLALFLLYAVVLVPLGGLGTAALLVRGIAIPDFVVAELLKFRGGLLVYVAFLTAVLWANLRLVLTTTFLVKDRGTVAAAMRASWRATRRATPRLLVLLVPVGLAALVVAGAAAALVLVPTRVADAHAPGAAAVVAGVGLAVVQVLGVVLAGAVAAIVAHVLVAVARERRPARLDGVVAMPLVPPPADAGDVASGPGRAVLTAGAVLGALALVATNTLAVSQVPEHLPGVVAHRGHPAAAVENSIPSLEAAAALGVDYVELDVLQAADGGLVVFHDTTLRRLAGSGRAVADLTLDELTATTIRQGGREATIPSLRDFVRRAKELDQPLLVELKLHGRETASYVPDVVALLREEGVADEYLVQAIYPELADAVSAAAPEIEVGYVVPLVRGVREVPDVDFLAVEQSSLGPRTRAVARAAGVDLLVWTVNDAAGLRAVLRAGDVDAVITSAPETAVRVRGEVEAETGVAPRLEHRVRETLRW
ncbi:glycerophosphoryl diester phosphodiesterase membrane domain-containing protein [Cellulosimicrobium cellulans]|uniref:glycerophosphoryl diester phosphodiesterase membrane domain-containing protein n=1 Tax=Cellulosimicrobium cellulans TaxID=1710 RepID=UPI0036E010D9